MPEPILLSTCSALQCNCPEWPSGIHCRSVAHLIFKPAVPVLGLASRLDPPLLRRRTEEDLFVYADLGMNKKMASKPQHKWIVMHSSMAVRIPRRNSDGIPTVDRFGNGIFNVRSVQPDEPIVLDAAMVDRLLEHGRGRKPRAKDFDDKVMPDLSPAEMAEESIN